MEEVFRKIGLFFLDTIETIVVSLAIFVVIYLFLFQPHQVKGASMEPNFVDGEYILTDKVTYRFKTPERGDVVIFKAPKNPELDFIKRIIGLPGERVKVENSTIYINGKKLDEPELPTKNITRGGSFLGEGEELTIPTNHYFVLGDNRNHSSDSREWGTIDKSAIIGRAFFRYWPPSRIGLIKKIKWPDMK